MTKHDLETTGPRADRPKRRRFTAEYKLQILQEYDTTPKGEKGAILRREGLYDSSIQLWRKQRNDGALKPGPHPLRRRHSHPLTPGRDVFGDAFRRPAVPGRASTPPGPLRPSAG